MAKRTLTLTANSSLSYLCTAHKPRMNDFYNATVNVYGTFGSGTISFFMSTDGGTNKVPMKDQTGTAYSTTAPDNFNVNLGVGNRNGEDILIYVTLSGATSPAITVDVMDNTG